MVPTPGLRRGLTAEDMALAVLRLCFAKSQAAGIRNVCTLTRPCTLAEVVAQLQQKNLEKSGPEFTGNLRYRPVGVLGHAGEVDLDFSVLQDVGGGAGSASELTVVICRLSLRERTCFRGAKADYHAKRTLPIEESDLHTTES